MVEPLAPPQPDEGAHPYGAKRGVRIHVPSALAGSLRGCRATVRGEAYDVQGDPVALTASPHGRYHNAKHDTILRNL